LSAVLQSFNQYKLKSRQKKFSYTGYYYPKKNFLSDELGVVGDESTLIIPHL